MTVVVRQHGQGFIVLSVAFSLSLEESIQTVTSFVLFLRFACNYVIYILFYFSILN